MKRTAAYSGNVADLGRKRPMLVHGKVEKPEKEITFLPFYRQTFYPVHFLLPQREWGISGKNISMAEDITHVYLDM